jgi:hypothetical protein
MHPITRAVLAATLLHATAVQAMPASAPVAVNLFDVERIQAHGARTVHPTPSRFAAPLDAASYTTTNPAVDFTTPSPAEVRRREIDSHLTEPTPRDSVPTTAFEIQQRELAAFHQNRLRYARPDHRDGRYGPPPVYPLVPLGETRTYYTHPMGGQCTSTAIGRSASSSCNLPW